MTNYRDIAIELVENGLVSAESMLTMALKYMSNDDVWICLTQTSSANASLMRSRTLMKLKSGTISIQIVKLGVDSVALRCYTIYNS